MYTGVFANLYCQDSDVAELAVGDFPVLVAKAERVAYGEDGAIAPSSFTLTSAFPFAAQGIQVGHVMVLESHTATNNRGVSAQQSMNGLLLVDSVAANAVTLKRLGYGSGLGAFAGGPAGATGITFFVPSLVAQILTATQEIQRRLNVTAATPLVAPTDFRVACVLMVLRGLYFAQYRQTNDDVFRAKMQDLDGQIMNEIASLTVTYGDQTPQGRSVLYGTMPPVERWREPRDW
jgi:hypothetical protein